VVIAVACREPLADIFKSVPGSLSFSAESGTVIDYLEPAAGSISSYPNQNAASILTRGDGIFDAVFDNRLQ
jgi:hypothetical protein